ncbi:MAG: hypothetical protein K9J84_02920 [Bacteroidia bacterium]|nr:hypothetical protein [Bacteroidia bacterium]
MKKIIIALLLTSSALFSYSQDVDITWGKEEKITRNSGTPQILGIEDVGIIILKSDDTKDLGDYKIAIHDKSNYDQTNLFELDKLLNKEIKSNDLEEVFLFEKTIIFISSNKTELMATTMN